MRPRLIDVPMLGRKLRLFRPLFDLGSERNLAAKLGCAPTTLATWTASGRAPKRALERLTELLVKLHPAGLDADAAWALWLGPYTSFEDVLLQRPMGSFLDALRAHEPNLDARLIKLDSSLNIVGGSVELELYVTDIPMTSEYIYEIAARPGMRLTVLCADLRGWRILAPSRLHTGEVSSATEFFPQRSVEPLWFADAGIHHFVLIEHPSGPEQLLPVSRGVAPVDLWPLNQFVAHLGLTSPRKDWRWTEAMYNVV